MRTRFLSVALAALLAGCNLAPDYERPGAPVPGSWPGGPAYAPNTIMRDAAGREIPVDAIGWREFMRDPALQRLVDIALVNNRNLRVAALNVEAAQAQFRTARADLFPQIFGTGSGTATRRPGDLAGSLDGHGVVAHEYNANIAVTSFELDLFGRLRNLTEAAFQDYLATYENQRSVQISLVAQVATGYLAILADNELVALSQQTLKTQQDALKVTAAGVAGGADTALAQRQAETSVQTARVSLIAYTRLRAQDENALALVLGQPVPPELLSGKKRLEDTLLADLPAGVSSQVLLRRPDVLAAEHQLQAANADIGAARAAFFPTISLTGSLGSASDRLSNLFGGGTGAWTFMPQISVPIFQGGRNQAQLDLAKIEKRVEIAQYELAIQTAFREVADALAGRGTYREQIRAQQALTAAYADAYRLSELRFRTGVDNYLATLDAQRELFASQQDLILLRQERLSNLVTLYKAMGGGWNAQTLIPATAPGPVAGAR